MRETQNKRENFKKVNSDEDTRLICVFLRKPLIGENHLLAIFKTNMHDPHKYLFRPKYRPPTIVSESKESKEFFSIFREKIDFEN